MFITGNFILIDAVNTSNADITSTIWFWMQVRVIDVPDRLCSSQLLIGEEAFSLFIPKSLLYTALTPGELYLTDLKFRRCIR
jgi:hypothetical protein